jgi:hypothetical protein
LPNQCDGRRSNRPGCSPPRRPAAPRSRRSRTKGGALEIEVTEETEKTFAFNVTRCRYAETYKAMGLGEIGHLLSCNRDGAFCEGYDPKLKLARSQTIMQGASHCDFKYTYEK